MSTNPPIAVRTPRATAKSFFIAPRRRVAVSARPSVPDAAGGSSSSSSPVAASSSCGTVASSEPTPASASRASFTASRPTPRASSTSSRYAASVAVVASVSATAVEASTSSRLRVAERRGRRRGERAVVEVLLDDEAGGLDGGDALADGVLRRRGRRLVQPASRAAAMTRHPDAATRTALDRAGAGPCAPFVADAFPRSSLMPRSSAPAARGDKALTGGASRSPRCRVLARPVVALRACRGDSRMSRARSG